MTKILKKSPVKNVRSHINSTYDFLDEYLPVRYTVLAKKKCLEKGINASSSVIRNVRTTRTESRLDVLNVLTEIAQEYKAIDENLKKNLKN